MPKKFVFGEGESRYEDLDFLFRLGQRAKKKDETLGFGDALLHRVELMLSKEKFTNGEGCSEAIKFANDELLPALDAEQRTKLSKARSAFFRKESQRGKKKIDVTLRTQSYLDDIHRLANELVAESEMIDKSSIAKLCTLEATMATFRQMICNENFDIDGFDEYVKCQFIKNIKESIENNEARKNRTYGVLTGVDFLFDTERDSN